MSDASRPWAELPATGTCDLTTTGRRSGAARTVEIWYVVLEGRLYVTGTPGPRAWLANVRAEPTARLSLRRPRREVDVDVRVVTDHAERRTVTEGAWRVQPWYAQQPPTVDDWVAGAPMVELTAR